MRSRSQSISHMISQVPICRPAVERSQSRARSRVISQVPVCRPAVERSQSRAISRVRRAALKFTHNLLGARDDASARTLVHASLCTHACARTIMHADDDSSVQILRRVLVVLLRLVSRCVLRRAAHASPRIAHAHVSPRHCHPDAVRTRRVQKQWS